MNTKELIDAAAAMLGGYAKLARALGVTPQKVNAWKTGTSCPLHVQAEIAHFAGLNWREHVCKVIAEKAGKVLASFVAGAVGMLTFGGSDDAAAAGVGLTHDTNHAYVYYVNSWAGPGGVAMAVRPCETAPLWCPERDMRYRTVPGLTMLRHADTAAAAAPRVS